MLVRCTLRTGLTLIFAAAAAWLLAPALLAQDEKPAPDKTAPPHEAVKPAEPAGGGQSAREIFDDRFDQWKELLKELRKTRTDFRDAEESQMPEIRRRWDEAIRRGHEIVPALRQAAQNAYLADPNADLNLTRFLVKLLDDDIENDQYEQAADLGAVLIDNNCGVEDVYNFAGIAAMALNDYDSADKYLKQAKSDDVLSDLGEKLEPEIENYKKYWKQEQEIRQKEAEKDDLPRVRLATSQGDIEVELFENEAPGTVGNFISLVEKGFYDGLTFHRVLKNFMAQGGDPVGDGTGGPGYSIYDELTDDNYRRHFRGSLSMANSGPNTAGSQFFITFLPTPHLNGKHTVFGRVIKGMEVLAKLQRRDPDAEPPLPEPDKIIKAEVIRKRDHEYAPNRVQ